MNQIVSYIKLSELSGGFFQNFLVVLVEFLPGSSVCQGQMRHFDRQASA